jgi:hypothetical protein
MTHFLTNSFMKLKPTPTLIEELSVVTFFLTNSFMKLKPTPTLIEEALSIL